MTWAPTVQDVRWSPYCIASKRISRNCLEGVLEGQFVMKWRNGGEICQRPDQIEELQARALFSFEFVAFLIIHP